MDRPTSNDKEEEKDLERDVPRYDRTTLTKAEQAQVIVWRDKINAGTFQVDDDDDWRALYDLFTEMSRRVQYSPRWRIYLDLIMDAGMLIAARMLKSNRNTPPADLDEYIEIGPSTLSDMVAGLGVAVAYHQDHVSTKAFVGRSLKYLPFDVLHQTDRMVADFVRLRRLFPESLPLLFRNAPPIYRQPRGSFDFPALVLNGWMTVAWLGENTPASGTYLPHVIDAEKEWIGPSGDIDQATKAMMEFARKIEKISTAYQKWERETCD